MAARFLDPYLLLTVLFFAVLFPREASAGLGMTEAEWRARFGSPNADGYYLHVHQGRREADLVIMPEVKDGRIDAAKVKLVSERAMTYSLAHEVAGKLAFKGDSEKTEYELSEDRTVLTIQPKPSKPDPFLSKPVLGMLTNDVRKRFGEQVEDGSYSFNGYTIKPQGNGRGKVVWVKAWRPDNKILSEAEIAELCLALTGESLKIRERKPGLFDDGKFLIVTTPPKKKKK